MQITLAFNDEEYNESLCAMNGSYLLQTLRDIDETLRACLKYEDAEHAEDTMIEVRKRISEATAFLGE
jgi:hypothetical protein